MHRSSRRLGDAWPLLLVPVTALVVRIHTAAASFETADERTWMVRSTGFWDSLSRGDLSAASAAPRGQTATMPGVTTMWLGSLSRGIWGVGTQLSLWDERDPVAYGGHHDFAFTRSGMEVTQVVMAVAASLLIGLLVVLLARWIGRAGAVTAGLLLATEPFLVAHGAVVHTDEMMALFGVGALVAWALALGIPERTDQQGRTRHAVLAGVLFAGAVLTKISALMLVPGAALLWVWAFRRNWLRQSEPPDGNADPALLRLGLGALGASLATFVLTYPALWVDPVGELRLLKRSAQLGDTNQYQYFLGEATERPSVAFYAVSLPFRMTPWFLVAAFLAGVAVWWRRETRGFGWSVLAVGITPLVVLSRADKKFDRYGLVLLVLAALVVGVVVGRVVLPWLATRLAEGRRAAALAGTAAAALLVLHGLVISPWGLAYFNPLMGGSARAQRNVLIGWGEGLERAGRRLDEVVDGRCDEVSVMGYMGWAAEYRCGRFPTPGELPDYVIIYVAFRQAGPLFTAVETRGRELVAEETIRGITYFQIYGPRSAS